MIDLQLAAGYVVPPRMAALLRRSKAFIKNRKYLPLVAQNQRFKNLHAGERCFIVCNGPSIKGQDLTALKGETVMSVSSGYHHKDYEVFAPKYHCTPQFTFSDNLPSANPAEACRSEYFTEDIAVAWLREMDKGVGRAEVFHSVNQASLISRFKLYPKRTVNFLCMAGEFTGKANQVIDLSKIVPGVTTVPIMAIMICLYMGFKEIYLLGTDHDSFRTREYHYFYDPKLNFGQNSKIYTGRVAEPVTDELLVYYNMFMQYRYLDSIARFQGKTIFNATAGGALEEFTRVPFPDVIR